MNKTKILTTLAIASTLMLATAATPASARWHGWGPGAALGIGAGLALGALGGYGAYPYYGYNNYNGYNDYPYNGAYGGYGGYRSYGAYGAYGGCAPHQYWSHGRWHRRYVC